MTQEERLNYITLIKAGSLKLSPVTTEEYLEFTKLLPNGVCAILQTKDGKFLFARRIQGIYCIGDSFDFDNEWADLITHVSLILINEQCTFQDIKNTINTITEIYERTNSL